MACRIRKTKTLFLTIAIFTSGLFIVLNLMMVELNSDNSKPRIVNLVDSYMVKKDIHISKKSNGMKEMNDYEAQFVAQGQRKPKTTNLENSHENDSFENTGDNKEKGKKRLGPKVDQADYENEEYENDNFEDDEKAKRGNAELSNKGGFKKDIINGEEVVYKDLHKVEEIEDLDDDYEKEDDTTPDDEYEYDDEPPAYNHALKTNPVFQPGDFGDIRGLEFYRKPQFKFEDVGIKVVENDAKKNVLDKRKDDEAVIRKYSIKPAGIPDLIQNGIYWSSYAESLIPKGLSYSNITKLIHSLQQQVVRTLEQPSWDKCGRPKNGFAVLGDGTQVCARYRQPHLAFVFGEALSFYLSRLLGMDNVPAVILVKTNSTSKQWRGVNISSLAWEDNKTIAFIQWIDNLNSGHSSYSKIPPLLLQAYQHGQPVTASVIKSSTLESNGSSYISDLVQWGSMLIFDYLTGNYDRVASMQDAADKENNPHIMEESIRNLRKSSTNGKLWLIDNESGLLDAYDLLNPYNSKTRFIKFHRQMLETMCVFQGSLVNALRRLNKYPFPHKRLINFASSLEPLIKEIPNDKQYKVFIEVFATRLREVIEWIDHCGNLDNT